MSAPSRTAAAAEQLSAAATAAAAALEAGELNEAIRGLMLRAGVYAGLSRDQIGNLMRATGEALEETTAAEAEEIFSWYMTTGNLPGEAE